MMSSSLLSCDNAWGFMSMDKVHPDLCIMYLQAQEERDFDPDRVVNSIRALALSVQDTGMFGDLPRPRIMTNPYAKRW